MSNDFVDVKIWVDDVRPAPEGYIWCKSVNETIDTIEIVNTCSDSFDSPISLIDLDHDAGDFYQDGGDYIRLLDYFEEAYGRGLPYAIRIHSMNPVGVQNMKRIIEKNNWRLVL